MKKVQGYRQSLRETPNISNVSCNQICGT